MEGYKRRQGKSEWRKDGSLERLLREKKIQKKKLEHKHHTHTPHAQGDNLTSTPWQGEDICVCYILYRGPLRNMNRDKAEKMKITERRKKEKVD